MSIKEIIINKAPLFIQNLAISFYNTHLYRKRHAKNFIKLKKYYFTLENLPNDVVSEECKEIERLFLEYASSNSKWYSQYKGKPLKDFPILEKDDIVNHLGDISTIKEKDAIISLTGGTTGSSMKVLYTSTDVIERQAILESFRAKFGHSLGKKTAWFSGKNIVTDNNIANGICFKDDYINKIRFFSTFHISASNFSLYWNALNNFHPEFIVGFPSSLYEICIIAHEKNLKYKGNIKVFFPTAEAMSKQQKKIISSVLGCRIIDQYASSEGAPFILECEYGNLHLHPYSGVFEVIDEDGNAAREGELIVTAFHTHGTPLIRYRIGDRIRLAPSNFKCDCGSSFKVVDNIIGRNNDFVWSTERGRVNLGNISNCTKNVNGILSFQIIQNHLGTIDVYICTNSSFSEIEKQKFNKNLVSIMGNNMKIKFHLVTAINKEKSGKFRLVKNNLKQIDFQ